MVKEFSWIGDWAARRAIITPNREAIIDNIEKNLYNYKELNFRTYKFL